MGLKDIPNGFTAEELADELSANEKQAAPLADKILKDAETASAAEKPASSSIENELNDDPTIKEINHSHSSQNAQLLVTMISFVMAFALVKLVDTKGEMSEYRFNDSESASIREGLEIWFNSFESDFILPPVLAPIIALGAVGYDKYSLAETNAKARKPTVTAEVKHPITHSNVVDFASRAQPTSSAKPFIPADQSTKVQTTEKEPTEKELEKPEKAENQPAKFNLPPVKKNKGGRPKGSTDKTPRKTKANKNPTATTKNP